MAAVRSLRFHGLIAGSVVLLGVGLLAVKIAATAERPLQLLASSAQRTAEGGRGVRVPGGGPREVALLAEAFNRMPTVQRQLDLRLRSH